MKLKTVIRLEFIISIISYFLFYYFAQIDTLQFNEISDILLFVFFGVSIFFTGAWITRIEMKKRFNLGDK